MKCKRVLLSLVMCMTLVFTMTFTSCGNSYSNVDIEDYIDVYDYSKMETEPISVSVSDSDVEEEIQSRLEENKTVTDSKEGTVEDGDTINIDYTGSIDGKKFSGGEETGRDLTIGSGTFIDGFESGLIGAKVGTTKNIKVTFPDDYSDSDLAGKNAVFAVKINSKEVETIPELDEDFVKEHSDVDTVEEYKKEVKKELKEEKEAEALDEKKTEIWNTLISESTMKKDDDGNEKYPEEQIKEVEDQMKALYEDMAKDQNMSLSDYLKQFNMTEDTFNEQVEEYAKSKVKRDMIMYYIADKEDIKISRSDKKEYVKNVLALYGFTEETYKKANNGKSYESVAGKDTIKTETLSDKVADYVVNLAIKNYEKSHEDSSKDK